MNKYSLNKYSYYRFEPNVGDGTTYAFNSLNKFVVIGDKKLFDLLQRIDMCSGDDAFDLDREMAGLNLFGDMAEYLTTLLKLLKNEIIVQTNA